MNPPLLPKSAPLRKDLNLQRQHLDMMTAGGLGVASNDCNPNSSYTLGLYRGMAGRGALDGNTAKKGFEDGVYVSPRRPGRSSSHAERSRRSFQLKDGMRGLGRCVQGSAHASKFRFVHQGLLSGPTPLNAINWKSALNLPAALMMVNF